MKRILGLSTLAALLMTPCMVQAQGIGLYVAPKLIYGKVSGYDMKVEEKWSGGSDSEKFSLGSDNVFGGGIAVGYDFQKGASLPLRAELEYAIFGDAKSKKTWSYSEPGGYSETGTNQTNISTKTLFANAYYDFRNSSKFTPYLGLGLGVSFLGMKGKSSYTEVDPGWPTEHYSTSFKKKSTSDFAWNVGGGVAYALTSNLSFDLAYRFASLGKGKAKYRYSDGDELTFKTDNLDMHQVTFGLRFAF